MAWTGLVLPMTSDLKNNLLKDHNVTCFVNISLRDSSHVTSCPLYHKWHTQFSKMLWLCNSTPGKTNKQTNKNTTQLCNALFSFRGFTLQHYFSDFEKHQVFIFIFFATFHLCSYLTCGRKCLVCQHHLSNLHLDSWCKNLRLPYDQN